MNSVIPYKFDGLFTLIVGFSIILLADSAALQDEILPSTNHKTHSFGHVDNLRVTPTVASPWPMPHSFATTPIAQPLNLLSFTFNAVGKTCDILQVAFVRYREIILGGITKTADKETQNTVLKFRPKSSILASNSEDADDMNADQGLTHLDVNVVSDCVGVIPQLEMDESYQLSIRTGSAVLTASSIWGALRGLETFAQLFYLSATQGLAINNTEITDMPRFPWRGILLDTSRHYLSVETILENLEAMAFNKINVFHWHIVDDNSFPYKSRDFPKMSDLGAYDPATHIYTQADIFLIIEFARFRGIRVVPEFDSPGHSRSWGYAIPNLLTPCYSGGTFNGDYGPVDPSVDSTFTFLTAFFKELTEVFKDKYLHLGGDEVSFGCWQSNPNITAFMQKMGYGTDYSKLESYYIQKLLDIVSSYNAGYVVWQEVFDNGVKVKPDTVIEVWKDGWQDELGRVTNTGLKAIISAPWYLDYISYGSDWRSYYNAEPTNFNGTAQQKALIVGGEACLWAEYVDDTNVVSRLWPRASAIAERLWSPMGMTDVDAAAPRMEEHRCRMLRRGINAEPANGPGYCAQEARHR